MNKYKIGQILTLEGITLICDLSGYIKEVPKGSKVIIGADKFKRYFKGGYMVPLPEGTEVEGYDHEGLAEWIFRRLEGYYDLGDALEDFGIDVDDFKEVIEDALFDIL